MNFHLQSLLAHVWWRFWWAPRACFQRWGLHLYVGQDRFVRLWGEAFVLQILIVLTTVPGMWFAGGPIDSMKWGFWILLASQPLWLVATWRAQQFGMFMVAGGYTALWLRAVLNHM